MLRTEWLGAGRRILLMFIAAGLLLGGTLLWLGWWMVRKDRELAEERLQQRRELAADFALPQLQESLARAEEQLAALAAAPPPEFQRRAAALDLADDSALIADSGSDMVVVPERRLAFYPLAPNGSEALESLFAAADKLEFQDKDFARALAALSAPLQSKEPAIRGAALMRVARINRNQNLRVEALAAYREMLELRDVVIEGVPAELIARRQSMSLLESESAEARSQATELLRALDTRRYAITRGVYEFYRGEAQTVLGSAVGAGDESLATAAEALHEMRNSEDPSGRFLSGSTLVLWQATGDRVVGMLLGRQWIAQQWPPDLKSILATNGVAIRLSDAAGQTVFGPTVAAPGREAVRLSAATHVPWDLHALTIDPDAALAPAKRRQDLLFAGIAAIAALLLTGSYLIARTIARELALSRLQSDFVSAISHEFRTPLTSLCLLSEHLASGRVVEGDRLEYFGVLARESQRLRRLVEGLLNFGRMESGTAQYRFETIDPAELVQSVSREFEQDEEARGHRIEIHAREDTPLVLADRAALACAVWNLVDNAAKYSPDCLTVWADVGRAGHFAAIRIRDRGIGIAPSEQGRIFQKFVRGAAAKQAGIRGTGIGLATVQYIVAAHQGELRMESKAGEGTEFTLLLPAMN